MKSHKRPVNEETEINRLDNAILNVTRKFRSRTDTTGYQSLSSVWSDLHPIILSILLLPSGPLAAQYLLRVTGDFHDHLVAFRGAEEAKDYIRAVDTTWVQLLSDARAASLSGTDRVRIANVLRDGKDRAAEVGVNGIDVNGVVVPVYQEALQVVMREQVAEAQEVVMRGEE
ncbi:hypothetical protein BC937DRAFT_94914 [Endogone sp. FLAS-F59071]|nr:hypothetical protein BC937DRAFT_94914 [Endogone sp. FLAS-F59071]|eukprot:RUS13695.1 hypothetical protein BC937DRAFT_94914 [Endogone sp. FLAS-F59071]